MIRIIIIFICLMNLFFPQVVFGQDTIYLNNSSFEDVPRTGTPFAPPIKGWQDCGLSRFPAETPPDIHPGSKPFWNVTTKAIDGETYLGLVVRDNDTWESVSQKLNTELKAGRCYSFSASLCSSASYLSNTKKSPDTLQNFSKPAVFFIWGGDAYCDKGEILAESTPIDHEEWLEYPFEFRPTKDIEYITVEAFYFTPIQESYNGHILIDGLSPIIEISCN